MAGPEPLWRAAPTRLLRRPGWSVLLAATAGILAAAAVSVPLFERSVAAAAVQAETSGAEPGAAPYESTGLRVTVDGVPPPDADAGLRAYLSAMPALGEPVVTSQGISEQLGKQGAIPFVQTGGRRERATLYYRDGAVDTLAAATGAPAATGGIWLPAAVATALGIAPGDPLEIGLDPPGTAPDRLAPTTLAGVYATSADSPLPLADAPGTWVTSDRDLPPRRERRYSAFAFADRATYDQLIADVGETPLWFADLRLVDDPSPEQARSAAAAIGALSRDAFTPGSAVAGLVARAQPEGAALTVTSGLPRAVSRAATTARLAQGQVSSLAVGGLGLGIGAVAGATALLLLSRRGEQELGARLGLHPAAAGALTAIEALIPVSVGSAAGAVVAWALVRLFGPSPQLGTGVAGTVSAPAAATLVAAVLVTFVTGAVTFAVLGRPAGSRLGRARLRVPWEAAVVAAAVVTGIAIVGAGPGAPGVLAVAFPAIAALAVATVTLRLLAMVARGAPAPAPTGSVRWLAARRARRSGPDVTATVLVLSVGAALLLWGLAVERGVSAGLEDKVAAGAGARTVARAGQSWTTSPPDGTGQVTAPLPDSTWAWRRSATLPPRFGQLDLLAVDPATFASVALPGGTTRRLAPGIAAVSGLRTADPANSRLRAIVVGVPAWRPGRSGTLDALGEWQVPFVVVSSVEAFPGIERQGVVVDADSIFSIVPDPRQEPEPGTDAGLRAGEFSAELWSSRPSGELEAVFGPADEGGAPLRTSADFAQNAAIRGGGWPLGLLVAYGACAFLLGAAVLVLHGQRLAERDRVADLLLSRMGLRRGALDAVRLLELGRLVLWPCAIAVVSVLAMSWLAPGLVDPAPRLEPAVRPALGWSDVVVLVVAAVVLVVVAATVARGRTVAAGEVLRGAG